MADDSDNYGAGIVLVDDPDFVPLDELLGKTEEEKEVVEKEEGKEPEGKEETKKNNSEAEGEEKNTSGQGRQEEEKEKEVSEDTDPKGQGSPETPSSIALALQDLKKVGVLRTLDDKTLASVKEASELKDLFQQEIENLRSEDQKRLAENQKRLEEILSTGMNPSAVQFYERETKRLNDYDEKMLEEEGPNGDEARKAILTLQYRLKRYSDEDMKELIDKSFDSGKDRDDAKKALRFCRETYDNAYKNAVAEAKEAREKQLEDNRKRMEAMREEVMNGKGYLEDLKVGKSQREEIFDYIGKPTYELKDADGNVVRDSKGDPVKVSGLTKFCREHTDEANRLFATILVLTNEGKDFSKLFKGPVSEAEKQINKRLEDAFVNGTSRKPNGSFAPTEGLSQVIDFDQIKGLATDE